MRIFLDANILFSAAKSAGAVRTLLGWLQDAGHVCVVDAYVLAEAQRNLAIKAPHALSALQELLSHLTVAGAPPPSATLPRDVKLVDKDRPVLASAIHLRCDALVTGDRTHFGALYGSDIAGVHIHSPRSLAAVLLAE